MWIVDVYHTGRKHTTTTPTITHHHFENVAGIYHWWHAAGVDLIVVRWATNYC